MSDEGFNVWLVEDNKLHAEMVSAALGTMAAIRIFDNGAALLEHVSSQATPACDVVVLDWKLPDMTGLEVCRFLRTTYNEIMLPIVMLTVQGNKNDVIEGLSAGANDYVTKPFDATELRVRVQTQIRVKRLDLDRRKAETERERYRELMLAMIGHDLRSPLSAISTGAQTLLLQEDRSDAQGRVLARIKNSTDRMSRMIEQIMDFTRSRFGGIQLTREAVDLESMLNRCIEEFELGHPGAAIAVEMTNAGRGQWDEDRLAQAIDNVLNNAFSYGKKGYPINVHAHGDTNAATIVISNLGEPINPALLQSLFDPFRRGADRTQVGQKGLGLGLYITRQIIEAHGGSVDVASTPDLGTRFTLTLPRAL